MRSVSDIMIQKGEPDSEYDEETSSIHVNLLGVRTFSKVAVVCKED